jgi:hypothetical protein
MKYFWILFLIFACYLSLKDFWDQKFQWISFVMITISFLQNILLEIEGAVNEPNRSDQKR